MGNPFAPSVQFLPVSYPDQMNNVGAPAISAASFLPDAASAAASGLTVELWFQASSPGVLVAQPLDCNGSILVAPVLYIDANGLLRGGLWAAGQPLLGGAGSLVSTLPVTDGEWHHAALSVAASSSGGQSLYLDGRLVASGTGTFAFSFTDSGNNTYSPTGTAQFGGVCTPPSSNAAQAFTGCLNELRSWLAGRTPTQIQQLMAIPLGSDLGPYQQQGLYSYFGSSELAPLATGPYTDAVSSAPPFDPFPEVVNRVPGFQNYGLYIVIPFAAPNVMVTILPFQVYSTKIVLRRGDSIQVTFPATDDNGDNFQGTFSLTATDGSNGAVFRQASIGASQNFLFTPAGTGSCRFDLTYSVAAPCTFNLAFYHLPGPSNPLMQLLQSFGSQPWVPAYTDPSYPLTTTALNDGAVTWPAYWPLLDDPISFPIAPGSNYGSADLLPAYMSLKSYALQHEPSTGAFGDYLDLTTGSIYLPDPPDNATGLSDLLSDAYTSVTGVTPPNPIPQPYVSAVDQVYDFIQQANTMRTTAYTFLSQYATWVQQNILQFLELDNVPVNTANTIYVAQQKVDVSLQGPSKGAFVTNLIMGSVFWGLGAAAVPASGLTAGVASMFSGFVTSGGANLASDLLGSACGSQNVQASLQDVSYTTLMDVATGTQKTFSDVYGKMCAQATDPGFLTVAFSNYGLLVAIQYLNAIQLYEVSNNQQESATAPKLQPIPLPTANVLTDAITYASWRALVTAVFQWQAIRLSAEHGMQGQPTTFLPTDTPYNQPVTGPFPGALPLNGVFSENQPLYDSMLKVLGEWQSGAKHAPPASFYSISPFCYKAAHSTFGAYHQYAGGMIFPWQLVANGNPMASSLTSSLFGIGDGQAALTMVDPNQPLQAAAGGWYLNMRPVAATATDPAAVTFPYDAFMNWAASAPSGFSPQALVASIDYWWWDTSTGATAVATDAPHPALVTLSANACDFGMQATGTPASVSLTLTNGLSETLDTISASVTGSGFSITSDVASSLAAGATGSITVSFNPAAQGSSAGTLTVTCSAPNSPFLVELTGIGVAPSASSSGNVTWQGDTSFWNQGLNVYGFDSYTDALANWNNPANATFATALPQQLCQLTGMQPGWLAISGNTGNGLQLFMILYFSNDVFLLLTQDGMQAAAGTWPPSGPSFPASPGSITLGDLDGAWSQGLQYFIFQSLADALANWNTGVGNIANGQLTIAGATAANLPSGWLVLCSMGDNIQPYIVTQYFNDITLFVQPSGGQPLLSVR